MSVPANIPPWDRRDFFALGAITLFGASLRLVALESIPPALWFDEGLNGFDALQVARGGPWPMVFPGVFPREPLLVYLIAVFVKIFGPQTFAVRLAPALIGSLAPPLLYCWLRQAAGRREALCAALFLAGMRWHLHFSRIAFRSIWTTSLSLAAMACLWRAFASGRTRWAAASGAFIGLGFYAYLSWYFFLPAAAVALALGLWRLTAPEKRTRFGLAFALGAAVVAAPIFIHYARAPDDAFGRANELSLFKDGLGPAMASISKNAREASLMLFWRGDHVSKHNIPWRPALEPIGAILFFLGCARCLLMIRRCVLAGVLLSWVVFTTGPTIFAYTDSPNFLRTLIMSPAVAALVGLGAAWLWGGIQRRAARPGVARAAALSLLGASVAWMLILYFFTWARLPELWGDFSGQADQIARYARARPEGETAFIPRPILDGSYTYRFLAAGAPRARPFSFAQAFGPGPDPTADHLIVESQSIDPRVLQTLYRDLPGATLDQEFLIRIGQNKNGGPIWARAWRLKPGQRLDARAAQNLESSPP